MWLRRSLDALHGCHGVGNGAGIGLEAQVARWPPASGGPSLLRYALTGPRGACAEQVLRVPKASIWTLLGVVSMQPVQQHCLARAERASIAWSSAESSHFALTFIHARRGRGRAAQLVLEHFQQLYGTVGGHFCDPDAWIQ
jgi:hypothetical protein